MQRTAFRPAAENADGIATLKRSRRAISVPRPRKIPCTNLSFNAALIGKHERKGVPTGCCIASRVVEMTTRNAGGRPSAALGNKASLLMRLF